jgi:mannosyl-oligosaccharide alpha-1,2-mannosidase
MFEVIICYLEGFIDTYDVSGCHDAHLLNKALRVADMAYATLETSECTPVSKWKPRKAAEGESKCQLSQYP